MKKVLIFLLVLALVAAGVGGWWWLKQREIDAFSRAPFGGGAAKTVDIPQGTGPKALSQLLAQHQIVSDAELLYGYLRKEKLGNKLKAGEYEFEGPMTPREVIARIISGRVKLYRFTVPEGLRADEILPIVAASGLNLSLVTLQQLVTTPSFLRKIGVPVDRIEGFLYPDTYAFTRGANEEMVLAKMAARTLEELRKAEAVRKAGVTLDLMQTLTLASIIEKETGAPEERPRIGCVFHNRLKLDMKLQTDPTVIYAKMLITGSYSKNITKRDLEAQHPYNTYTTKGLPPGPISSPGAKAIQAALNPIECNDLFFVSRNDTTHVFCPDLACHEANVERWQRQYFRDKKKGKNRKR